MSRSSRKLTESPARERQRDPLSSERPFSLHSEGWNCRPWKSAIEKPTQNSPSPPKSWTCGRASSIGETNEAGRRVLVYVPRAEQTAAGAHSHPRLRDPLPDRDHSG